MRTGKKNDIILIAALLIIALFLVLFQKSDQIGRLLKQPGGSENKTIVVTVNGEETLRLNTSELSLPYEFTVKGYEGKDKDKDNTNPGCNVFVIRDNADGTVGVQCVEADCPDKVCVDKGFIVLPDDPIVCLPHRVIVKIE